MFVGRLFEQCPILQLSSQSLSQQRAPAGLLAPAGRPAVLRPAAVRPLPRWSADPAVAQTSRCRRLRSSVSSWRCRTTPHHSQTPKTWLQMDFVIAIAISEGLLATARQQSDLHQQNGDGGALKLKAWQLWADTETTTRGESTGARKAQMARQKGRWKRFE